MLQRAPQRWCTVPVRLPHCALAGVIKQLSDTYGRERRSWFCDFIAMAQSGLAYMTPVAAQLMFMLSFRTTPGQACVRSNCFCFQGLVGPLPSFTPTLAVTFTELRVSNTSLQQCDASHLAVDRGGLTGTTLRAGSSSSIGADNLTGCLPDFLLFCEQEQVPNTALKCPAVAFRRPVEAPFEQLTVVALSTPSCAAVIAVHHVQHSPSLVHLHLLSRCAVCVLLLDVMPHVVWPVCIISTNTTGQVSPTSRLASSDECITTDPAASVHLWTGQQATVGSTGSTASAQRMCCVVPILYYSKLDPAHASL